MKVLILITGLIVMIAIFIVLFDLIIYRPNNNKPKASIDDFWFIIIFTIISNFLIFTSGILFGRENMIKKIESGEYKVIEKATQTVYKLIKNE